MIYICGPTSSGKTSLAIKLCQKFNGEIVSADSRQIYKYFDVGTGKLPVTDKYKIERNDKYWIVNGIKIWMYDFIDPKEYYSAADYTKDAQKIIDKIEAQDKRAFIVGGTGLYIDALLGKIDLDKNFEPNWETRKQLENSSIEELQKLLPLNTLKQMNNSDRNNPRRLIRRIEMLEEGQNNSDFKLNKFIDYSNMVQLIGSREILYSRVDSWVDAIWEKLVIEVETLIDNNFTETNIMKGLIYRTVVKYLENGISDKEAISRIKYDLHAYIRRQETYFRKFEGARILNIEDPNFDTNGKALVELICNEKKTCRSNN